MSSNMPRSTPVSDATGSASQLDPPLALSLLERAHEPAVAETIYREKVRQRTLLLRPSSPDPSQDAREKRRAARRAKAAARRKQGVTLPEVSTSKSTESRALAGNSHGRPLSAKQKRAWGVYAIPSHQQQFARYLPLWRMWCSYMREILGFESSQSPTGTSSTSQKSYVDASSAGPILVSADYHGALMTVVRSRCTSRVGLEGIVVRETKFTFELITRNNALKCVPKEGTIVRFEVPLQDDSEGDVQMTGTEATDPSGRDQKKPLVFELHASQFMVRPPDRANRKFKLHIDPDL